jgi:hypothetical protein
VESRDDERAMSNDVAGGEMFEYGDEKNTPLAYLDILIELARIFWWLRSCVYMFAKASGLCLCCGGRIFRTTRGE